MLLLPRRVEVRLKDIRDRPLAAADILIGLNLLVEGRYYYGNLVGLTNDQGHAVVLGQELETRFDIDRARFPMDYKVGLDGCDSTIEVQILSESEVETARRSIAADYSIAPSIRDLYDQARNERVAPALARVQVSSAMAQDLVIDLTTYRVVTGLPDR